MEDNNNALAADSSESNAAAIDAVMAADKQSGEAAVLALAKSLDFNGENRGYVVFHDAHDERRTLQLSQRAMEVISVMLMAGRELVLLNDGALNALAVHAPRTYQTLLMMAQALSGEIADDSITGSAAVVDRDVAAQRIQAAYFVAGEIGLLASIASANHQQLHALQHALGDENPLRADYATSDAGAVKRRVAEILADAKNVAEAVAA